MAQIPVLDHHQKVTDTPRKWRKASLVKRLISRGLLEWLIKPSLARELSPEEIRVRSERAASLIKASKILRTPWESPEVPGVLFEPPNIRHNPDAAIVRRQDPREWDWSREFLDTVLA